MSEDKKQTDININIEPFPFPEKAIENLTLKPTEIIGEVISAGLNKLALKARMSYYLTEYELSMFKESLNTKSNEIPQEHRTFNNLDITQKILSDSTFKLKQAEVRDLFENLIVASLDDRKSDYVHPRFSSILTEIQKEEAELLKYLHEFKTIKLIDPYYVQYNHFLSSNTSCYFSGNRGFKIFEENTISFKEYGYYNSQLELVIIEDSHYKESDISFQISILKGLEILTEAYTKEFETLEITDDTLEIHFDDIHTHNLSNDIRIKKLKKFKPFKDFISLDEGEIPIEAIEFDTETYKLTEFGEKLLKCLFD